MPFLEHWLAKVKKERKLTNSTILGRIYLGCCRRNGVGKENVIFFSGFIV